MEGLRQDASSRALGKRVQFTDEEVEVIKLYFQSYTASWATGLVNRPSTQDSLSFRPIESSEAPSTDACRELLRQHQMATQAKQVRDKVSHLILRREEEKEEEHWERTSIGSHCRV